MKYAVRNLGLIKKIMFSFAVFRFLRCLDFAKDAFTGRRTKQNKQQKYIKQLYLQ